MIKDQTPSTEPFYWVHKLTLCYLWCVCRCTVCFMPPPSWICTGVLTWSTALPSASQSQWTVMNSISSWWVFWNPLQTFSLYLNICCLKVWTMATWSFFKFVLIQFFILNWSFYFCAVKLNPETSGQMSAPPTWSHSHLSVTLLSHWRFRAGMKPNLFQQSGGLNRDVWFKIKWGGGWRTKWSSVFSPNKEKVRAEVANYSVSGSTNAGANGKHDLIRSSATTCCGRKSEQLIMTTLVKTDLNFKTMAITHIRKTISHQRIQPFPFEFVMNYSSSCSFTL